MIDWTRTDNFTHDEWPGSVLQDMDPRLFHECLFPLRERSGVPMTPSPLPNGHVRQQGDSRHSIRGGERLADATDLFIQSDQRSIMAVIDAIEQIPAIGGWGVYCDTTPSVMIHIDRRPDRLCWLRVGGDYIYRVNDPAFYYAELARQLEKLR